MTTNRLLLCLFLSVCILLPACDQKKASSEIVVEEPERPKPVEKPVKPVEEIKVVKAEPPPPPMPRLAPEGIYYLTQRVSVMTDDGVHAASPGAQVKLVRKTDTGMLVNDGRKEFEVQPAQVTNDLDIAFRAGNLEAQNRAIASDNLRAQSAAVQIQRQSTPSSQSGANSAENGILQARYDALLREEANIRAQLAQARKQEDDRAAASNAGRVAVRSTSSTQMAAWDSRLGAIDMEKTRIKRDMARLGK